MCVEVMISPFGILIEMGLYVLCLLTQGVSSVMKWPVVPESATACGAVSTLLDEPTVEVEDERVFGITKSLKKLCSTTEFSSPICHSGL